MSAKAEKTAITICTTLLVILAVIGVFIIAGWATVSIAELGPVTSAQAYVNTVTTSDGEEKYFMELEYWENADGTGKEVFEFTFNAYSDIKMQAVLGKGVQFVYNDGARQGLEELASLFFGTDSILGDLAGWDTFAYDKDEIGNAWASTNEVEYGDPMFLSIGDKVYSATMDGTYTTVTKSFNFIKAVTNFLPLLFTDAAGLSDDEWYNNVYTTEHEYTMKDFYNEVLYAAAHTNTGYGSTVLNMVELGKYMSIREVNDQGQEVEVTDHDHNEVYFAVKVTKHREGFRRASESSFGQLLGDSSYTTVPTDNIYNDYSEIEITPYLTSRDFNYYQLAGTDGYIPKIKPETLERLEASGANGFVVVFDERDGIFADGKKIVGITADSFGGLKVKNLSVTLYRPADEKAVFTVFGSDDFESVTGIDLDNEIQFSLGKINSSGGSGVEWIDPVLDPFPVIFEEVTV